MNIDLQKKLVKNFPSFFDKDFYFECDDGWYELIFKLCEDIKSKLNDKEKSDFKILQVKEKFATLRVYCANSNDEIFELIQKASQESASICEITGGIGQLHQCGGYFKTLNTETAKLLKFKPVKNKKD